MSSLGKSESIAKTLAEYRIKGVCSDIIELL